MRRRRNSLAPIASVNRALDASHPRYFVKCSACDQTFWVTGKRAPVPEHGPWNRHVERAPSANFGCPGAGGAGHWIGEETIPTPRP